ncbi:MAG: 2-oxoglutarate dehydrogenase E1 component [Capsulimonadaceae bacterium]|nr:2-oxoglutarate dehydrogenase E1 component [Capsulimonadaceae bacterium]
MSSLSAFHGPNAGYVLDLYDLYKADPNSVDEATRQYFEQWTPEETTEAAAPAKKPDVAPILSPTTVTKVVGAARYARYIRELGHLEARIDPLNGDPPGDPGLDLATHGLSNRDLDMLPASIVGGACAQGALSCRDALARLMDVYSGTVGYEDDHVQNAEERGWLREAAESRRFFDTVTDEDKLEVLNRLTQVECFEKFLHQTFIGQKRFSIEGTDILVPVLDEIIRLAAACETHEVVIGMAHRGRLNVLTHVLGKPYEAIISEFQAAHSLTQSVSGSASMGWTGDVKYHLGARRAYAADGDREMPITLAPNPSHLEFVNPVIEGRARAAQEDRHVIGAPHQNQRASLAILIHGDAAFPGQGVVAETLNLSRIAGYGVGGSIHIISNNQIGFTTPPKESRSTLYASDLAKGFEIPIVHVNADDPIACIAVARMAHAYREKFSKDFLIDIVGYRRYGHNEGDEPTATQPLMYQQINDHPRVREIWATRLQKHGLIDGNYADQLVTAAMKALDEAKTRATKKTATPVPALAQKPRRIRPEAGPVTAERLLRINDAILVRPEGFTGNAKLERNFQRRKTSILADGGIEWGHAEALAFATIIEDGTPIRLTGQDAERGTFAHRHAVLHDPVSDIEYTPLQNLPTAKASFAIYNSPLSEISTVGFEYGYSSHADGALVLWEAQFGDFSNCAQVIIDQFIVSGSAKWKQAPSLVMLLPHGYEGQGPEHSSARIERYLQLAANDNIRVVNCTNAAQYFHALRRQASELSGTPRPLIVMTPKSLLRHPRAASSMTDLVNGQFQSFLSGPVKAHDSDVTRVILCSGKVYVDLIGNDAFAGSQNIAVYRIEELYPFPSDTLLREFARYGSLEQVVWMQEEPANQGAWTFVRPRVEALLRPGIELSYAGRGESASPAEGSLSRHIAQQDEIIGSALRDVPQPQKRRSPVTHGS